jgi:hypothetical protein
VATRRASAAAGDAGDWISAYWFTRSTEFYKDHGAEKRDEAGVGKRGHHSQSSEPLRATSAAALQSPISA